MEETKIEKNIPLRGIPSKYPLAKMEVGDSFSAPIENRTKISSSITSYKLKDPEKVFATRRVDENTLRIWRTK